MQQSPVRQLGHKMKRPRRRFFEGVGWIKVPCPCCYGGDDHIRKYEKYPVKKSLRDHREGVMPFLDGKEQ